MRPSTHPGTHARTHARTHAHALPRTHAPRCLWTPFFYSELHWRSEALSNSTSIEAKFEASTEVELGSTSECYEPTGVLQHDAKAPQVGSLACARPSTRPPWPTGPCLALRKVEIFLLLHLIMCNQLFLACFSFVALRSVQPQISCWIYLFLRRQRAPNPKIENDRRRPTGA